MVDFSHPQKRIQTERKKGEKAESKDCRWKKGNKCVLLGLRVEKLFLDSIIFFSDFFRLARRTQLALLFRLPPHLRTSPAAAGTKVSRWDFFMFFSSFSSFHSNENHLNIIVIFFRPPKTPPSALIPLVALIQFTFIQNGWIFLRFLLFRFAKAAEMRMREIVVVNGIYRKRFVCVCVFAWWALKVAGLAKCEPERFEERKEIWWDHVTRVE